MDLLLKVMYLKFDFHKSVNSSTISDADYTTDTPLFSQKITWQKKKNRERETERQIIKDYPIFKDNFGQRLYGNLSRVKRFSSRKLEILREHFMQRWLDKEQKWYGPNRSRRY